MSYASNIDAELQRLFGGPGQLVVDDTPARLRVDLLSVDRLGCEFIDFVYETPALARLTTPELKKLGHKLATSLTYLTEPIHVVEIDGQAGVAQLRSAMPVIMPTGSRYYEVLARRGGSLSIQRYEATPGQARHSVPAVVTREVFHRLAEDFAKAASGV